MSGEDGGRDGDRVLIVDDDPDVIALVEATLEDAGVTVDRAVSAEEAFQRIATRRPQLILLDVMLPDRSGLETMKMLRERGVEVPIVVITSHASMEVAIEAMKEGAYDFVTKPVRPAALERLVEEALGEDREAGTPVEVAPEEPGEMGTRLVGRSPPIVEVYKTIGRVARTNATVLVAGESGTGKELVARTIHQNSHRSQGPFLAINCAAIPENLLESELFGHEKGAFTGAIARSAGKFERARGGTLFLDEIGDMSMALQAKVLRVLEQREIERVGGSETLPVDVRIIAATNRDLEGAVEEEEFREDLYYRLAVVRIGLPPLRERKSDIRLLTEHFVSHLSSQVGRTVEGVEPEVYERLESYHWPGNVRELRNVLERSLILGKGSTLRLRDLPPLEGTRPDGDGGPPSLAELAERGESLEELERRYILHVLDREEWNYSQAARVLGIHRNTLRRKLDRYGVERPG